MASRSVQAEQAGCVNTVTRFCTSSYLGIANFIDALAGLVISGYAGWLWHKHYAPMWLWSLLGTPLSFIWRRLSMLRYLKV